MTYAFERLNAWKEARKLVVQVYQLLDKFPNLNDLQPQIDIVARMLNGLRASLLKKINPKP